MIPEARQVWRGLEFRRQSLLKLLEPLSSDEMSWLPGVGRNSIAWQLWHIAEVEDNWIRRISGEPARYPFGLSVREANPGEYPDKVALIWYRSAKPE
jgi:uncharacterized damage-inducible protein DinB